MKHTYLTPYEQDKLNSFLFKWAKELAKFDKAFQQTVSSKTQVKMVWKQFGYYVDMSYTYDGNFKGKILVTDVLNKKLFERKFTVPFKSKNVAFSEK